MHTALDQSMFWVGAFFVFTPIIFAGIVLGYWWNWRKREEAAKRGTTPSEPVT